MVAWQSPHFRLPWMLALKVCASTPTLLPAASRKAASAWQLRQSVSAQAARGAYFRPAEALGQARRDAAEELSAAVNA